MKNTTFFLSLSMTWQRRTKKVKNKNHAGFADDQNCYENFFFSSFTGRADDPINSLSVEPIVSRSPIFFFLTFYTR